jgi:hypothetical protein
MKVAFALILVACACAIPARAQTTAAPAQQPQPQPKVIQQMPPSRLETVGNGVPERPDAAKDAAVRHLLDVTGESKLADNLSGTISMQIRSAVQTKLTGDRLQKFMVDFDAKFRASATPKQVVDAVVPYYANAFTAEEVQEIVKFYESPVGQKMVQTMPQVSHDTQQAGFAIERKAALDTLQSMLTDYPEVAPLMPGAQPAGGQAPAQAPAGQTPATQQPAAQAPAPQAGAPKPSLGNPNPPAGTPHQ